MTPQAPGWLDRRARPLVGLPDRDGDEDYRDEAAAAEDDGEPAPRDAQASEAGGCQSTRPIQRSWFSAYQRIVRSTPSSHDTWGCQPVSAVSFS